MKNKTIKLIVIIVTILIILDQASKILIGNMFHETWGNEYFKIEITKNTGMAFGFNDGNGKNILITILVIGLIISFIKKQIEQIDTKTAVSLSLVLGGGISNFIDRIFRGGVFDFIKIVDFPNFNLADVFVVTGWILLVAFVAVFTRKINNTSNEEIMEKEEAKEEK